MNNQRVDSFAEYWENRARTFAGTGRGLAAVCSFGMPAFYNSLIHQSQRLALLPWLDVPEGGTVLDAGCGVGRWSRLMARRGALVSGVDLSPAMIGEAVRRARDERVADRCRFMVGDLATLRLDRTFDRILVVTVLQHILDESAAGEAVRRLAAHLAPAGRLVVLEAAPTREVRAYDHAAFRARTADEYMSLFSRAGLRCLRMTGVDPARFKQPAVALFQRLPRLLGWALLGLASAAAAPIDLIAGRLLVGRSWHKVFVLAHEQKGDL
jgi:2-polyprenyl-3-methyl-5-hydroxy-6-metoxy-1,4-benzoquinol methylase